MTAKKHHAQDKNQFQRYFRLMPRHSSADLLILKGHLLIEEQLQLIITEHFGSGDFLDDARFSFSQKFHIVKAIAGNTGMWPQIWRAIDKLNKLRNSTAHSAEAEDLAKEIDLFISEWEEERYKPSATRKERTSRLRKAIDGIFGGLLAVQKVEEYKRQKPTVG